MSVTGGTLTLPSDDAVLTDISNLLQNEDCSSEELYSQVVGRLTTLAIKTKGNLFYQPVTLRWSLPHQILLRGNIELMNYFLHHYSYNLNNLHLNRHKPLLHLACVLGKLEFVQVLLQHGANPWLPCYDTIILETLPRARLALKYQEMHLGMPVWYAIGGDHASVLEILLFQKTKSKHKLKHMLMLALGAQALECTKHLINLLKRRKKLVKILKDALPLACKSGISFVKLFMVVDNDKCFKILYNDLECLCTYYSHVGVLPHSPDKATCAEFTRLFLQGCSANKHLVPSSFINSDVFRALIKRCAIVDDSTTRGGDDAIVDDVIKTFDILFSIAGRSSLIDDAVLNVIRSMAYGLVANNGPTTDPKQSFRLVKILSYLVRTDFMAPRVGNVFLKHLLNFPFQTESTITGELNEEFITEYIDTLTECMVRLQPDRETIQAHFVKFISTLFSFTYLNTRNSLRHLCQLFTRVVGVLCKYGLNFNARPSDDDEGLTLYTSLIKESWQLVNRRKMPQEEGHVLFATWAVVSSQHVCARGKEGTGLALYVYLENILTRVVLYEALHLTEVSAPYSEMYSEVSYTTAAVKLLLSHLPLMRIKYKTRIIDKFLNFAQKFPSWVPTSGDSDLDRFYGQMKDKLDVFLTVPTLKESCRLSIRENIFDFIDFNCCIENTSSGNFPISSDEDTMYPSDDPYIAESIHKLECHGLIIGKRTRFEVCVNSLPLPFPMKDYILGLTCLVNLCLDLHVCDYKVVALSPCIM